MPKDLRHDRLVETEPTYTAAYREAYSRMTAVTELHPDYAPPDQAHYRAAFEAEVALHAAQGEAADRAAAKRDREAAKALEADRQMTDGRLEHAHALLDAARREPDNRSLAVRASTAAAAAGLTERQRCAACDDPDADPLWRPGVDPVAFFFMCERCASNKYGTMDSRALLRRREREARREVS